MMSSKRKHGQIKIGFMGGSHHSAVGIADCDGGKGGSFVGDRSGDGGEVGGATGVGNSNVMFFGACGGT